MDYPTLVIALLIFALIYQGIGFALEARQSKTPTWSSDLPATSTSSRTLRDVVYKVSQTGLNKAILRNKRYRERMELMLIKSGHVFGWKVEDFLFYKELTAGCGLLLVWQSGHTNPLIWIAGAVIGFMFPDVYVKGKGTARLAEIQKQLPGLVDLIALTLESGLDLLAAIERIVSKMKPGALREELQTVIQENRLGTPRKEALEHLAFRAPLSDIQSLTSMIIQSEELGTSLSTVLRSYAEDMRSRRILRAEEMAGKMPVKILFPMMVFFFPIVFVIIFGPLALNFLSSYK
jgi:tight adherence protein C